MSGEVSLPGLHDLSAAHGPQPCEFADLSRGPHLTLSTPKRLCLQMKPYTRTWRQPVWPMKTKHLRLLRPVYTYTPNLALATLTTMGSFELAKTLYPGCLGPPHLQGTHQTTGQELLRMMSSGALIVTGSHRLETPNTPQASLLAHHMTPHWSMLRA